jgi:hypothetical protein
MSWQHGLQMLLGLVFLCCVAVVGYPYIVARMSRRNRRINLPPPSSACDRKYDAGWWT